MTFTTIQKANIETELAPLEEHCLFGPFTHTDLVLIKHHLGRTTIGQFRDEEEAVAIHKLNQWIRNLLKGHDRAGGL